MEGWSAVFTLAALAGVLLTLAGAWWMVRVLRARKPQPKLHERDVHERSPGPSRPH